MPTNSRQVIHVLLYCLYRRLLPRHVKPDSGLHRAMWAVQKTVPMVVLGQKTVFYAGEFLTTHAQLDVSRLDPPNPLVHRRTFVTHFDACLGQQAAATVSQCKAWFVLVEAKIQVRGRVKG